MGLLLHILGVDDVSGRWYGFWSGFGSDIGELGIIGGLIGLLRHKNCHVHGCIRLGRHRVEGTEWMVCAKHHPVGAPTVASIQPKNTKDGEQP